jgi:hypothetical protein
MVEPLDAERQQRDRRDEQEQFHGCVIVQGSGVQGSRFTGSGFMTMQACRAHDPSKIPLAH